MTENLPVSHSVVTPTPAVLAGQISIVPSSALQNETRRGRAGSDQAGFTMVELLVALTGGLFVSVVVFALARDASRFYQREGRASNAMLAAIAGFERLRNDVARAGFLATGNVAADPFVCSRPGVGAPALMQRLASIRITNGGSPANATLTANSMTPDSVVLAGSYSSSDEFPVRNVILNANATYSVYLQPASGAMARLGYVGLATPAERTAKLAEVFATNRALRIVDHEGRQHYGFIAGVGVGAGGNQPQITLSGTMPLIFRSTNSRLCGLTAEPGATANVVNFIRYDIRSLSDVTAYSGLYTARAGALGEATRTELVRAELDPTDGAGTALLGIGGATPIQELVAEYAVDFDLEPAAVVGANLAPDPDVQQVTPADAATFASITGNTGAAQRIRSVRVRLGVRSREADRGADVPAQADVAAGRYRILLGTEGGQSRYARIRTLQADIMINNNAGITW